MGDLADAIVEKAQAAYTAATRYRGMDTSGPMRAALAAVDPELRALYACKGAGCESKVEVVTRHLGFAAEAITEPPTMPKDAYHLAAAQVHATLALAGEVAQLRALLTAES
jgi:hypothetical protein